jgi:hypothetical protein
MLLAMLLTEMRAQDFSYRNTNGTITVTGYTGPGGAVSIPSTIVGLPVTSLGDWVFAGSNNLTSVIIADSVTNIGKSTFRGCTGLASVTFGTSVKTIGSVAFAGCSSLTNLGIPDSVEVIRRNFDFRAAGGI